MHESKWDLEAVLLSQIASSFIPPFLLSDFMSFLLSTVRTVLSLPFLTSMRYFLMPMELQTAHLLVCGSRKSTFSQSFIQLVCERYGDARRPLLPWNWAAVL